MSGYEEFVAGARAVPGNNGWIVQVFRVPHPTGHVPVALRTLENDFWSSEAADEMLKTEYGFEPAPESSWHWHQHLSAYGRRFVRPAGWGERRA